MAKKYIDDCDEFEVLDFLGSGAYGAVFAARNRCSEKIVAIKSCKDILTSRTLAKRTLRELRILRHCDHQNIVRLLYIIIPKEKDTLAELNFVFELLDTDLAQIIRSPQVLLLDHVQYFAVQLVSALDYLHRSNIIHRDVKPRNILVNADCTLKLADFGLAKVFQDGVDTTNTAVTDYVTTRWYRAPEVLAGCTQYGAAIDMWAVGCIIVELFQRIPLFPGTDTNRQVELIVSTLGLPDARFMAVCKRSIRKLMARLADIAPARSNLKLKFGRIPADAIDLITRLLTLDPASRLSSSECLLHKFLACTNYPRLDDAQLLQINTSEFAHEQSEITIDLLHNELLQEVKYYHPGWCGNNTDMEEEEVGAEEHLPNTLPDVDVSTDAEDLDLEREISMIPIPVPESVNCKLKLEDVNLFDQFKSASPTEEALRRSSDASLSSCKTVVRDWMEEDGRTSVDTFIDRILSKESIVETFVPPPDFVEAAYKDFSKPNALLKDGTERGMKVSMDTIVPIQSESLDYELKTLRSVPEYESAVAWTTRPLSVSDQTMDCKSLLSFGLCSSGNDFVEKPEWNAHFQEESMPEIAGKKRSLPSTTSFGSSSTNSIRREDMLRKDPRNSSCILS